MSERRGGGKWGAPVKGQVLDRKPVNKKATLVRLLRYMMHFRWLLLLALALTLFSNVFAMIGPKLSGNAIDCIAAEGGVDFAGVGYYVMLMLLFYLGSSVLSYLLSILMVHISRQVTLRMRRDLFERLSDMPVSFIDTHPVGDLISRIFYDTDTINTSLSSDVVHVLASLVTIVGSLVMMLSISWQMTLAALLILPQERYAAAYEAAFAAQGLNVLNYPLREMHFAPMTASLEFEQQRLGVLHAVMQGKADVVITTPDAALQYTMPPSELGTLCRTFSPGDRLTPQSLAALAAACGYAAADAVDGVGQFARRGGMVDLFAPGAQEPVRIEFFGDEIESIAPFDLITQRRGESIPAFPPRAS